jgi:putative ATPase
MELFENLRSVDAGKPLADRMRPQTLDEFVGHDAIIGPDKPLRLAIVRDKLFSMLFWGPPGSGKTTLAQIVAKSSNSRFLPFSAVSAGVKEIRESAIQASLDLKTTGTRTILFLDEIHRFNKAQQDYLLPHVENGAITLIGATTENPSFEVNSALLSRLGVFILEPLSHNDLLKIIQNAMTNREKGLGGLDLEINEDAANFIASVSDGDARKALNILEVSASQANLRKRPVIDLKTTQDSAQARNIRYDRGGEEHFNLISALHKSLRDSDPDGGLYWMARMLDGGEDPLYIARRLVRFASEDVGLAAPQGLNMAVAAFQACQYIGMPECALALAQTVVYLACSPKSNSLEAAYISLKDEIRHSGALPVPMCIRNAPTKFMKEIGYGKGYKYAHDFPDAQVDQQHLPDKLVGKRFYFPTDRGFEATIKDRLDRKIKDEKS